MDEIQNDDAIICPVCKENYTESGPRVPRLLTCSHTACHTCLDAMMKGTSLVCAECRKKHRAPKGVESFPENRYVIDHMKYLAKEIKAKRSIGKRQCVNHKRDLIFLCKNSSCSKEICPVCMIQDHSGHKVVDILKEMKEKNVPKIELLSESIAKREEKLLTARKERGKVAKDCLETLTKRREEVNVIFNNMIEKVEEDWCTTESDIDIRCRDLNEQLEELKRIKEAIEKSEVVTNEDIVFIEKASKCVREETPTYSFFIYNDLNLKETETKKVFGDLISVQPSFHTQGDSFSFNCYHS